MCGQDQLIKVRQDDLPRAATQNLLERTLREHGGHRLGLRLWTLLHAQVLLNGPGSSAQAIAFVEDDYRHLRTPARS